MSGDLRKKTKAELHVHLEGSIDAEALREIDASLTRAEIEQNTAFDTFEGFLRAYIWVNRQLKKPEHYAIAARRLFERFAEQGIGYAEVTLSAGIVLWKEQPLAEVYDALWRESQRSAVEVYWIPDAIRHFGVEHARQVAEFAVSRRGEGVIAFGIGGDEVRGPAEWFKDIFQYARDGGLHLVCHAGEAAGPESVWAALAIGAERIGHGIAAAKDEGLMTHLREKGVPLEVCVTSNVRTGVVRDLRAHPLRRLYDAGVPITLNTDDPALFGTTLGRELEIAREQFGFTEVEIESVMDNAFRYAFVQQGAGRR